MPTRLGASMRWSQREEGGEGERVLQDAFEGSSRRR